MRVFFDHNTSPVITAVIDGFLKATKSGSAHHLRTMEAYGFDRATPDIDWITRLGSDTPANWLVITGDHRIRRNRPERIAWKQVRLKAIVLSQGFQKMRVHQAASLILWRWLEIEAFISSAAPGSMFELPVGRSAGFVSLTV